MTPPQESNQRWGLDFVADQLVDGRRFRVLVVVDDFTRECLVPGARRRHLALRACGSPANSMRSSPFAASRSWSSATTALS
jgi:transposase InsO family protein